MCLRRYSALPLAVIVSVCLVILNAASAAETPSVKQVLEFRPISSDVEYEIPEPKTHADCKVNVERQGKSSGWVVLGPSGQTLRRFVDTNGDNVVDQWRYYQNGLEVYRDIDSNFNNKVDQMRWLNTAGSRWGLDTNEDRKLDTWKSLSAEEASREAIRAIIARDETAFSHVLIDKDDLTKLGLKGTLAEKLLANVADAGAKARKLAGQSKALGPKCRWMRFDSLMPAIVPADQVGSRVDLYVYENVMAMTETGSDPGLVQIGEMIRVDDVWKLTRVPQPVEGDAPQLAEGLLMQPAVEPVNVAGTSPLTTGTPNAAVQKLIEELQELDKESPAPGAAKTVFAKYNAQRADVMQKLLDAAETDEERDQWTRQMADGIAAAVQTGSYPAGLARLQKLSADVSRKAPKSDLAAYVAYRKLLAEYGLETQQADNDKQSEIQERWLKDLEQFVKAHPKAEDAAEATLQLAITQEFNGKVKEARVWYARLVSDHASTTAAKRAGGALKRLDLKGKPFELKGAGLKGGTLDIAEMKGKVVLVLYWATWCKPCTEDLPQLRSLYEQYHDRGFEVVGVNLDTSTEEIQPYLTEHRITWPQIHEAGGFSSPPAQAFGIISLPTMFLVDRDGKVVHRGAAVADLKTVLPEVIPAE